MTERYVVVLAPQPSGGWCAHFPDFPGCRAMGDQIEVAIENSSREAVSRIENAHALPRPRAEEEIRADKAWARQRGINWSTAVISLVPLSINNSG